QPDLSEVRGHRPTSIVEEQWMPQVIEIPPLQRVRVVGHEMPMEEAAAQYLFVLVLREQQKWRPDWAVPHNHARARSELRTRRLSWGMPSIGTGRSRKKGVATKMCPRLWAATNPSTLASNSRVQIFRQIAMGQLSLACPPSAGPVVGRLKYRVFSALPRTCSV